KLHQQFESYKEQVKKMGEETKPAQDQKSEAPTCGICHKTKFADGCGHLCSYCQTKFCARCGGRVSLRSNKVTLTCTIALLQRTGTSSASSQKLRRPASDPKLEFLSKGLGLNSDVGLGRAERSLGVTFTVPRRCRLDSELPEVLKVDSFRRVRGKELPTAASIAHRKAIFLPNTMLSVSGTTVLTPTFSSVQVMWVCNLCRKQQEILTKSGAWFYPSGPGQVRGVFEGGPQGKKAKLQDPSLYPYHGTSGDLTPASDRSRPHGGLLPRQASLDNGSGLRYPGPGDAATDSSVLSHFNGAFSAPQNILQTELFEQALSNIGDSVSVAVRCTVMGGESQQHSSPTDISAVVSIGVSPPISLPRTLTLSSLVPSR
ncbi:Regulating synaptic membrane exocytosis protein 2, partial [Takifugu flavidus]